MRDDQNRVRQYEMMVIFVPDLAEEDLPGAIERVSSIVATANGEVTHVSRESPWGRRRLAYPIRHAGRDLRDGFYTLYYFEAAASAIVEIERELKLYDSVIRHMITHQVQAPAMPEPAEETPGEAAAPTAEAATAEPAAAEPAAAEESAEPAVAGEVSAPAEAESEQVEPAPTEPAPAEEGDGAVAAPESASDEQS